jgi:tripartite-type tricarboxylate transporter receptor subunit TctC
MSLHRLVFATLAISAALAHSVHAASGDYPNRPIRFVVPLAPGGAVDIAARAVGQGLATRLGQQVVVDNRAGGGGNIGAEIVAKAPPDGYTMVMGSSSNFGVNPTLYKNLPYDAIRDFAPVSLVSFAPNALYVHPSVPAQNVKELVALAKARPAQLHFGSAGNGSVLHLAGELFRSAARVDIVHVPYKGGGPALIDLLAGQVELMIVDIPHALPHVTANKLRPLGVTGRTRSAQLPAVPTVHESGVPGYEVATWSGFLAPAGTPPDVINRLHGELAKVLATPDLKKTFSTQAVDVVAMPPERFGALIREEIGKWGKVVRTANVKLD